MQGVSASRNQNPCFPLMPPTGKRLLAASLARLFSYFVMVAARTRPLSKCWIRNKMIL